VWKIKFKFICNNVIIAIVLTGPAVLKSRIPMIPNDLHLDFKIIQFSFKLSYLVTINKAKGQTFKHVGIDLCQDYFSHRRYVIKMRLQRKPVCSSTIRK